MHYNMPEIDTQEKVIMITIKESQKLMEKLCDLKKIYAETKSHSDLITLQKHERLCIEKFDYLIKMRTCRYRSFSNYEDLNQEGQLALLRAMKTYDPKRGNWFSWAHKYISTRISRAANMHSTIRYPLHVAKTNPPHREAILPTLIEDNIDPEKNVQHSQLSQIVSSAMEVLPEAQRKIIDLAFGFDGDKPMSVNKICKKLNIPRSICVKAIDDALLLMKENIKI